jgi:hypothetical protein
VIFSAAQVLTLYLARKLEAAVVAQMKPVRAQQALSQAVVAVVAFRQIHIAEALTLMVLAVVMVALPPRTLITTPVAVQELLAMGQMGQMAQLTVVALEE